MEAFADSSLIDAESLPAPRDDRPRLDRTSSQALCAMELEVGWQSEHARHADVYLAPKVNLWRDIIPPALEQQIMDRPIGHRAVQRFAAGELLPAYDERDCLLIRPSEFNRRARRNYVEPRAGRFYPRGFIAGVRGIFSDEHLPFRVAEVDGERLRVDLNPPLAGRELTIGATLLDIWASGGEHGGLCNDLASLATDRGPGMQARWRGQPTDFWSDLPFVRISPSDDAEFYERPRMVNHLDRTALRQIERLYERLLPRGGRILDLMASWRSHVTDTVRPSGVTGLGMNAEELAANALLTERVVHDLNEDPRLPFPDESFDAVVCTVSVEYLIRPFEVFADLARVLRPGGRVITTFSNRWFPPKVVRVWEEAHEFERMGLVLEYFLRSGLYVGLETFSLRGLPRPEDDRYAGQLSHSDPVYAVWGQRAG